MAHGPNHVGGRYRLLDPDPDPDPDLQPRKKYKNTNLPFMNIFPDLPPRSNLINPRFLIMSPKSNEKPIISLSPFVLKKAIDKISKDYEKITQLRDGSLLIFVSSQKTADIFLKAKELKDLTDNCPIEVKLHDRLNQSKGIAYAPCLINVSEKEILTEMKSQRVTEIYKFTKKGDDGKPKPTGLMLFTFDLYQLPKSVDIGLFSAKLTEYIPNPMRCRNCQLLGHTSKRCNGNTKCEICNLPPHIPEPCSRTMCANCSLSHPSSSKSCPSYKQAKEIITIKTLKKCTMNEAKKLYSQQNLTQTPPLTESFAQNAKKATVPSSQLQTSLPTNSDTLPPVSLNTLDTIQKNKSATTNTNSTLKPSTSITSLPNKHEHTSSHHEINKSAIKSNTHTKTTTSTSISSHSLLNSSQSPLNNNTTPNSHSSTSTNLTPTDKPISPPVPHSPISDVTRKLLDNEDYYISNPEEHDVEMQQQKY